MFDLQLSWLHYRDLEYYVYTTRDQSIMLIFCQLYYAAVLITFTYYAQNYAQGNKICA